MSRADSHIGALPEKLLAAGVGVSGSFAAGELGTLIHLHGVQNRADFGFNIVHEAYCARIAADFLLRENPGRSRLWLARRRLPPPSIGNAVAGSVFICECPDDVAQLRLLFVDDAQRGLGLGRWLVEDSIRYCREAGFRSVFLWTVEGLDRAQSVYKSLGFAVTEAKENAEWGDEQKAEIRYDLQIG
jgi:GNAT superfamily N-acetyltransferase